MIPASGASGRTLVVDGRELLAFCGCDYLGLAHHPAVVGAAQEELRTSGLSASAARGTTGTFTAHLELEAALARWTGCEDAVIVADGYLADLALLEGLACLEGGRAAGVDREAHPSLHAALRLAGYESTTLPPRPAPGALERLDLVATDGVYPMEGRAPDIARLRAELPARAWLLVDDSHGLGTMGRGHGALLEAGLERHPRSAITSSLAKGLGGGGGLVAGPHQLIESVRRSSAYSTTTPVSPASARASLAALEVLERDDSLLARLGEHTRWLFGLATELGLAPAGGSLPLPVLGVTPRDARSSRDLAQRLLVAGIHARHVDYPGDSRPGAFRIVLRAPHTTEDRELLGEALRAAHRDGLLETS